MGDIKTQICEMVALLSTEFGINAPSITFTRSCTGTYYSRRHRIAIGMTPWRGIENTVLHEFAHALANILYGRIRRTPFGKTIRHGPEFAHCLIEIINAWYGDQVKYPWDTEYKNLQAYGPQKPKKDRRRPALPLRKQKGENENA
jgi:hypothetical protein